MHFVVAWPCPGLRGCGATNCVRKNRAAWTVERAVSDRPGAVPSKSPREKHPFADPTAATQKQTGAKRCAGETHTGRPRCVPRHDQPVAHSCGYGTGAGRGCRASENHHTTVHNEPRDRRGIDFRLSSRGELNTGASSALLQRPSAAFAQMSYANLSLNLTCKRAERSDSEAASPHVAK